MTTHLKADTLKSLHAGLIGPASGGERARAMGSLVTGDPTALVIGWPAINLTLARTICLRKHPCSTGKPNKYTRNEVYR